MAHKVDRLEHRFVRFIPDQLETAILYVSIEYRTATHLCCCGCGDKVVTPISPADWELTFNGRTVSLWPSIAGGRCKSHYVIRQGRVAWARPLSKLEEETALRHDRVAAERVYDGSEAGPGDAADEQLVATRAPWWHGIFGFMRIRH